MADNPFITSANPQQLMQQAQQIPAELQPDLRDITRQQQLANMLTQQAFQQPQGQMVSGRYVAPSFFQNIAPMVNAYLGQRGAEQADIKQAALAQKLREGGDVEMQKFNELMKVGTPEARQQAFQYAQTARYSPLLRNIGAEMLKPQKLGADETITLPNFAGGAPIELARGPDKKSTDMINYAQAQKEGFKGSFTDYQMALKRAGANNTMVNVQSFMPFQQQLQGDMAKALVEDYKSLSKLPTEINQLNQAMNIVKNNQAFVGTGAETKAQIANFFNNNFGTSIDPSKVGSTGELGTLLFNQTMQDLKKVDSSPSQQQQAEMQKAFGTIGSDPNALVKILDIRKQALLQGAERHNERVKQAVNAGTKFVYDINIKMPEAPRTPPPAGVTQQQWDLMDAEQRKKFGG
jgi:hypothetical protein